MKTFEQCCEYLGISTELPKCQIRERQHQAAYKLSVCMAAWNKVDCFEPDGTANYYQEEVGYTPHFQYKDGKLLSSGFALSASYAGIVIAYGYDTDLSVAANFSFRFSFKTRERAVEFSETFIETFNELL